MNQHTAANISDGTIRRFLLAQLSRGEQSAFEQALLMNPLLEQRTRLAEIALIDDYVLSRLKANDRDLFQKEFLVTTARRRKLEVSNALRQTFAVEKGSQPAHSSGAHNLFVRSTFAWRIAFAIVLLMVLFASALVIRKEPQIVKRIIPKRLRPAAIVTPTPAAAHHPANSSELPDHRDETPHLPAHEAAPQTIVLPANSSADNARIVSLTSNAAKAVRFELMLETHESATFSIVVTTSIGEVVYSAPEFRVENANRIDFDVQIERLKPGEYQATLTRHTGEASVAGTFYFRVQ
jgi:hypothetical protein